METQIHMISIHPRMGFQSVQMNSSIALHLRCNSELNEKQIELF